jgi:Putative auto-transporter adhesin, head GIN domain
MRLVFVGIAAASLAAAGTTAVLAANDAPVTLQKSFPGSKVVVDGFRGTLTITTAAPGAPVSIRANGKAEVMKHLDVRQDANGVRIQVQSQNSSAWWPWSVLDWSDRRDEDISMTIGAPKGTEFDMEDVTGTVSAGDLDAPLRFGGMGGGSAKFGKITQARIEVAGSMDVSLGDSQGPLDIEIAGSGDVKAGSSAKVRLSVAGSGEFSSGDIAGGFDADFAGAGDALVASVNGPVSIDIAGSGNVVIKAGRADPLKVQIAGSGDVDFGGEAVNPNISISGSGSVTVGSMSGSLSQEIHGSGDFVIKKPAQPMPPPQPAPPEQPAAPSPPAPQ